MDKKATDALFLTSKVAPDHQFRIYSKTNGYKTRTKRRIMHFVHTCPSLLQLTMAPLTKLTAVTVPP